MIRRSMLGFSRGMRTKAFPTVSYRITKRYGSSEGNSGSSWALPVAGVGALAVGYAFMGMDNSSNKQPSIPQPPYEGLDVPITGKQYVDGYPNFTPKHKSLMRKHLTLAMYDKYKDTKTKLGVTLQQSIKTGVDTPHLIVGMTAGDETAYDTFKDLFNPIIKGYHGYDPATQKHKSDLDATKIQFDSRTARVFDRYVVSTRIRAARSLRGHLLPSNTNKDDRAAVESKLRNIFENKFSGELKGTYYPLGSLTDSQTNFLRSNGFLFQKPRPTNLLYFSGAARDWPHGRGIFHNNDHTFLAWVNEEDHCRIISMAKGGDVKDVFARFCKASQIFSQNASIMHSETLGFIGTCPSNLGTGLRASVMIKLPHFNKDVHLLEKACAKLSLQPRGSSGEHSAAIGGKWDISNKHRIGYSEVELVQKMIDGVKQIIVWEEMLASGDKNKVMRQVDNL